ncbi:MAG: tetratricopeptide repeat protein [Gammaproteobacteria bacterium]|nr:tetratricopeptide repeat protein [Gammaproteobacteria bacterium]MYG67119.1 tetratricopeptide repeat protein [Gammaproteobacteria bacterium]
MSANSSAQKAQKLFADAATKLQRGDAAGARRGLEKVSRMAPNSAAVWYNLGLAGQHLGLHSKAIREYEKSLRITPDQVDALVNIGLSYKHMENADAARKAVEKALNLAPAHPRALNLLGSLFAESGDSAVALDCFRRSLVSEPGNPDARLNLTSLVRELQAVGNPDGALEALEPLLNLPGITRELQELHAQILLDLRRFDHAESLILDLKSRFPEKESVWVLEMLYFEWNKDLYAVIDVAKKILERNPEEARVWDTLGRIYFELNSIDESRACHQKAIDLDPENPEYRNHIGLTYAALGEKKQAEENYRVAISLNATDVEAYRNLTSMRKFTSLDDPDVQSLQALWERDELSDDARCRLAFALGKIYDDCGLYDRAFEIYEIGNRFKSEEIARSGFDFDQYFGHIERIAETFNKPPSVTADVISGSARPIFVLGVSRSGTTLVEQIISRHPDVTGRGELPCIERAISRLEKEYGEMRVYPDDFLRLDKADFDNETREYLDWVTRLHNLNTAHFTDKMPFNFVHIWLIRALFPNASIIHCHRHPLDIILSNYFQWFGSDINYVYDLQILARFYVCFHRLMQHWHRVFPEVIHRVQYEALIADKENQIRELIRGAGLDWDQACLDSGRSDTAVRTASVWQVRQGIYTSSRERWRNYARYLSPAIGILRTEGILDSDFQYSH